jgi:hypothetical protein
MFYDCSNLETIYASTWFVTDNVTNSSYMFSNNRKLIWWNWTRFSESYVDYAKLDTSSISWYFTDKNFITVNFTVYPEIFETQVVQYWEKVVQPITNPVKEWILFKMWIDKNWQEYNFDLEIKRYTEIC